MSLMRQVWLLVLGVIVLACTGSVVVSVWSARNYLENQLTLKNNDNAQALALTLTQQGGDPALLELALAAQFDTGYYRSIRFRRADGSVQIERLAGVVPLRAPGWFVQFVPIASHPGVAQVSSGWTATGSVEVVSQPEFAYADLWLSAQHTGAWMLLLGLGASGASTLVVRRLRRPLEAVVEQAEALTQRRFITVAEPDVPELKRVARAMNTMVERIHRQFAQQAEELARLGRQANCDLLTGLSHRNHFLARFASELSGEDGLASGRLVMVRLLRLAEVNQRIGHQQTNLALTRVAQSLAAPMSGQVPVALGRLNGSDFAMILPGRVGESRELAELVERQRGLLVDFDGVAVAISEVGWHHGEEATLVLARADATLARAEAHGDFACERASDGVPIGGTDGGEDDWRRGIQAALSHRRVRLMDFPVIDRQGRLLHHECPLRLQLAEDGPHVSAAHWLPLALRTGLTAEVDELAVQMGLSAVAADGQARSINVSPQSLRVADFVPRLRERLAAQPAAARRISIEVDEAGLLHGTAEIAELCRQLHPFGAQVGLEHAGERLSQVAALLESGLDFVKLTSSLGLGLKGDEARIALLRGTVQTLHGLGVATYIEGVVDSADLQLVWDCGVDGATGPGVKVR